MPHLIAHCLCWSWGWKQNQLGAIDLSERQPRAAVRHPQPFSSSRLLTHESQPSPSIFAHGPSIKQLVHVESCRLPLVCLGDGALGCAVGSKPRTWGMQ